MWKQDEFTQDEWNALRLAAENRGRTTVVDVRGVINDSRRATEAVKSLIEKKVVRMVRERQKRTLLVTADVEGVPKVDTRKLPKERNCLRCGVSFLSTHVGHRVCVNCKLSEDWRDGSQDECSIRF